MPAWIPYTAIRLGLFALVLAVLLLLQVPWWLAAIAAALIGFGLGYVLLAPLRERMAAELARSRERDATPSAPARRGSDEDVEDAASDAD
ncbi:MAG: DUF4229 domain-containing protein [Actinomycetales bacterium]|nr:DUF4229 domain-containing protein [Actinomycetales bacterium]